MDPEKLRKLQIKSEARRRPTGMIWIILFGVIVVSGAAVYFALPRAGDDVRLAKSSLVKPYDRSTNASPASPTNSTTAASSNDVLLTVSGYIVNRERIELSPRFLGQVKWIGVKKGDTVTNGQVLVLLDDAEYRARLREMLGRRLGAQASLAKAELDYARIRKLIASGVETPQAEDDARIRLDSARAQQKEVEASVQLAQTYLDWCTIRSTIDGVVLEKLVDAGELVTPQSFGGARGPSTAFLALADPKDLQVEIDLNEQSLAKVFLGQRCRVSPEAFRDRVYEGRVAEMSPEANRQKGTLQIKVQILSPDKYLTPELTAQVDFLHRSP